MAGDLARGRTKTTFVRVHGAELSAQAEHEAEKLNDDPVSPELKAPVVPTSPRPTPVPGARIDVRQLDTGKPIAMPVEIRISGDDMTALR